MDGIDALTLGPADLAQDLGVFGTPDQARALDEKRDLILAAARKHGKTCAMLVTSEEQAKQWKEAGALLLVYLSDVEMLHAGFSAGDGEDPRQLISAELLRLRGGTSQPVLSAHAITCWRVGNSRHARGSPGGQLSWTTGGATSGAGGGAGVCAIAAPASAKNR